MHTAETTSWLPPDQLQRYQWAKFFTGLIAAIIFISWLTIQWSNPGMRVLAIVLIAITTWVVIHSLRTDARHARNRQISIDRHRMRLWVTAPDQTAEILLADVDHAEWRHDNLQQAGLWMFDKQGQTMAHLDLECLSDEAEARTFVGWVRRLTQTTFPVQWPKTN